MNNRTRSEPSKTNRRSPEGSYHNVRPHRNITNHSHGEYNGAAIRRNESNGNERSRTIKVKDLNRLTIPATLMSFFDRFGVVDSVTLDEDDEGRKTGSATVVFKKSPLDPDALVNTPHRIDGKRVHIEFIRNQAQEGRSSNEQTARLLARTFCMGSMIGVNTFVEEWKTNNDVKLWINYTLRNCTIFFKQLNEEYKVVYKFKDLSTDMVVEREGNVTAFTISLRHPGQFWRRNNNVITETSFSSKRGQKWERVTLIPLTPDSDITSRPSSPFLPLPRKGVLNIGSWIVYRIVFNPGSNHKANFEQQLQEAAFFNLVPQNLENCKPKIKIVEASTLPKPFDHADRSNKWNFDFDVLYMLESCISYYYFNEYNLTKEFYDMIANVDPSFAIGVLQIISQAKKPVYDPYEKFYDIWKRMGNRVKEEKTIPSHCTMLRKVIITPSHIYYQPPTLETTNRVIRHYKDQCDSFIRIQFVDEGFNRVGASGANGDTVSKNAIYNRIYDVLKRGVQIGKRRFEFLAFSSSQLREQGCWFFAPTRELTPNDIRNWMGVFSHEKVVAKHAVRMGQCFSSTRPIYTLTTDQIEYIDDIVRGQYTFSDGVGKISPSLAQQVALKMELKTVPSAFQFRLGGAKGVLTVSKELENKKVQIQLRPSQIKFESEHTTLEVIRPSTYIHSYLNRQAITLLACLGVPDDVFMTLMHEMIQDVNRLFQKSEEAIRVLLGNVDQAGTAVSLVSILQAGFLEHRDPFIRNMLNLFRIMVLKDLKKKAKIIVPQGAYLLGVMDETGTLEEGEVFVQICDTTSNGTNKRIITGDAVVYRNPCFHPGDIRTVKAVDKKELHHLFDVIVFPQKGFRDIPSMCSGGDLDGDDYTVYWDPRLLPSTKNYPPMDYTPEPPKKVDKVQIKDIIKFFVNYMDNDVLGQIANAHLATADLSPLGARDGRCIKLAHLHSTAVDFPKSGKPAVFKPELRVSQFPDFMQKKDKPSYKSEKVLGKIFREIDKADYKNYQSTLTQETVYDTRMIVPDMELYIAEARTLKTQYNRQLYAHMNHYGIQTEAEVCSGFIIKWLKSGKNKSKYEQHDYAMKVINNFKSTWKKRFEQEFLDASKTIDKSRKHYIDAKAAAWYYVAYHPDERMKDMSVEGGFFSFPWCVYEYICDVAKRNKPKEKVNYPTIDEESIKEGIKKLAILRNDAAVIDDDEEDDMFDDEDDHDYDTLDESSDDEVIIAPTPGRSSIHRVLSAAGKPVISQANSGNRGSQDKTASQTLTSTSASRQTVLHADATEEDIVAALLGNTSM